LNYEAYFQDVSSDRVAAELGGLRDVDIVRCIVGIESWASLFEVPSSSFISRDVMESGYAECVRLLNLGTPAIDIEDADL